MHANDRVNKSYTMIHDRMIKSMSSQCVVTSQLVCEDGVARLYMMFRLIDFNNVFCLPIFCADPPSGDLRTCIDEGICNVI